jgi:hypothetical protein
MVVAHEVRLESCGDGARFSLAAVTVHGSLFFIFLCSLKYASHSVWSPVALARPSLSTTGSKSGRDDWLGTGGESVVLLVPISICN